MKIMNKQTIGFGINSGFKLDGVEITEEQARRHWHDQSADWTQGAFEAMAQIVLAEKPAKERKTSKKLLTEKVDHFFWHADYMQGGTSLENAHQLAPLIPKLEEEAAEIARLLENAGKLVLEDAWLVGYAGQTVPAKLASLKARLPQAAETLAKHASEAPTSPPQARKAPFAPLALFVPEIDTQAPTSPEPTDGEIFAALGLLNRANPENVKKILVKFS